MVPVRSWLLPPPPPPLSCRAFAPPTAAKEPDAALDAFGIDKGEAELAALVLVKPVEEL